MKHVLLILAGMAAGKGSCGAAGRKEEEQGVMASELSGWLRSKLLATRCAQPRRSRLLIDLQNADISIRSVPKEDLVDRFIVVHEIYIRELQTDDTWIEGEEISKAIEKC